MSTGPIFPDENDSINIAVVFTDKEALQEWAAKPEYDGLIDELDSYHSRSYWEFAKAITGTEDLETLEWEKVDVSKITLEVV